MSATIKSILDGLAAANASRVLTLPVAGAGLPAGVTARLGQVADVLGHLDVVGATITEAAGSTTVRGRVAALGCNDLDAQLVLGPADALTLTLTGAGELATGVAWTSIALGLSAAAGDPSLAGTFTGGLSVGGRNVPLTLNRFDSVRPATWTLAVGAGAAVAPADLPGFADLLAHLPAASGAIASATLRLVTSGDDPRLAFDVGLTQTLTVAKALSVTVTTLTPMVRFAESPGVAFEAAGSVTALGFTQAGSVRLTPGPLGVELRAELHAGSAAPSLLTVDGLARAFLGHSAQVLVADLPAGFAARVASSGFAQVAVVAGPIEGAIAFEGRGTFLGWAADGRIDVTPSLDGTDVGVRLDLDEPPVTLASIAAGLGLPATAHLPAIGLALRELRYDPTGPEFTVGGAVTVTGSTWELDVRIDAGQAGGISFEAGTIYDARGRTPPTLGELFDTLLVGAPHTGLLTALAAAAPPAFTNLVTGARVERAAVTSFPASTGHAGGWMADLVITAGTVSAQFSVEASGDQWRARFSSPHLHGDVLDIASKLGLPTPTKPGLAAGQLEVRCDRVEIGTDGLDLVCEIDIEGAEATLTVQVRRNGPAWDWGLDLAIGGLVLDVEVKTGARAEFRASLRTGAEGVRVSDVASLLGVEDVPPEVDLALDKVDLKFVPSESGAGLVLEVAVPRPRATVSAAFATELLAARTPPVRAWALRAGAPGIHLGLDGIPVLGRLIPDVAALAIELVRPALTYANLDLDVGEAGRLGQLVGDAGFAPAGAPLARGLSLGGTLQLGGTSVALDPASTSPRAPPAAGGGQKPAPPAVGPLTWKAVNASLGPVHIASVGFGAADGRVLLGVTGSVNLSVLELTLVGLRLGVPVAALTDPARLREATFGLDGAGLQVNAPGVSLGGALVRSGERLDGVAVLSASGTSISLLASFTRTARGAPSLFMWGVLDRQIGGPSFFFVTGLAAGFGYNRGFVEPAVEAVPDFPLVKSALGDGPRPRSTDELVKLLEDPSTAASFPPVDGGMFLAAGVRFTSFKVVESFVMLGVTWGTDQTTILVLGTSHLELPPKPPPTAPAPTVPPVAVINLALKAKYEVERGRLEVRGLLVGSYILSHACTLTGGFAVIAHFKDDPADVARAGDFVVTIGGYHPRFAPSGWYPSVPRLGLTWRVDDNLYVKGDAYFALTTSSAMAGGSLDACWEKGGLSARFTLAADFEVQWQPYHYAAQFGIGIRGGLHWGLLDFSISIHAEVDVYGPPFGGRATLDLGITSMTVEFGSGRPVRTPLPAAEFPANFLPDHAEVCGATVRAGALGQNKDTGVWSVGPGAVELAIHTAVPVTAATAGADAVKALADGRSGGAAVPAAHPDSPITDTVLLAPCEKTATAPLAFAVVRLEADGTASDVTSRFDVAPTFKELPTALWDRAPRAGGPSKAARAGAEAAALAAAVASGPDEAPAAPRTATALAGFVLAAKASPASPATAMLHFDDLASERLNDAEEVAGLLPLEVRLGSYRVVATPAGRADVLRGLGFDPAVVGPNPRPSHGIAVPSLASA